MKRLVPTVAGKLMIMTDQGGHPDEPIELVEEELVVSKRQVETGRIRVSTHVDEHVEHVQESLFRTDVDLQRVRIDRVVDGVPEVRLEGDTLVYPIVEEVVVKQLILREELRITRRQRAEAFSQDVTLRRVRAEVERTPSPPHPEAVPQTKG